MKLPVVRPRSNQFFRDNFSPKQPCIRTRTGILSLFFVDNAIIYSQCPKTQTVTSID